MELSVVDIIILNGWKNPSPHTFNWLVGGGGGGHRENLEWKKWNNLKICMSYCLKVLSLNNYATVLNKFVGCCHKRQKGRMMDFVSLRTQQRYRSAKMYTDYANSLLVIPVLRVDAYECCYLDSKYFSKTHRAISCVERNNEIQIFLLCMECAS